MGKKKKRKKQVHEEEVFESDENFYMIIDYTSGGAPFGITWEVAIRDGLVENPETKELSDDELPF